MKPQSHTIVPGTDIKKPFGASVKAWRNRLGLSQEKLAERAGLHRTYISDIERGARNISLESVEKLAHALEISIATLFSFLREPAPVKSLSENDLVDILLVEDSQDDVTLTLDALVHANFANRIQVVHDGEEALDFLFCQGAYQHRQRGDLPQMVLLDLNLPRMNGLEVLRQIKSNPRTHTIPVVVLTSSNRDRDIQASKQGGAATYIVKPVDLQRLSEVTPQLNLRWALLKSAGARGLVH